MELSFQSTVVLLFIAMIVMLIVSFVLDGRERRRRMRDFVCDGCGTIVGYEYLLTERNKEMRRRAEISKQWRTEGIRGHHARSWIFQCPHCKTDLHFSERRDSVRGRPFEL